jgi:hypothetical protein
MKTIILCVLFVFSLTATAFATTPQPTSNIVITQETLMLMTDADRNAVFDGIKKQAKLQQINNTEISSDTIKYLSDMDVNVFKGKVSAVADVLVLFFDKLGVKANEFINTPIGLLAALGIIYKIGVFQGIWMGIVNIVSLSIFLIILYKLNTKKIISTAIKDENGTVIGTKDTIVPKFSAIASCDTDEQTIYSVVGSILCVILIVIIIASM